MIGYDNNPLKYKKGLNFYSKTCEICNPIP